MPRPFVFLDRDGTVIAERNYLSSPEGVELLPNAAAGLRRMRGKGFGLVLVTNQSGIGRGYYSEEDYARVHRRLVELLAAEGVWFDAAYHCPHAPDWPCGCRKPAPGMLLRAARELGADIPASVVVGDKPCDIALARAAGAGQAILVRTGYGEAGDAVPDAVADDLLAAAEAIKTPGGHA